MAPGEVDDAVAQVKADLERISQERASLKRQASALLQAAREAVAVALLSGIRPDEAIELTGYSSRTIEGWVKRARRAHVASLTLDGARSALRAIKQTRHRLAEADRALARQAEQAAGLAWQRGVEPEDVAEVSGYTLGTVERWYATADRIVRQAARQARVEQVRSGLRMTPAKWTTHGRNSWSAKLRDEALAVMAERRAEWNGRDWQPPAEGKLRYVRIRWEGEQYPYRLQPAKQRRRRRKRRKK